MATRSVRPRPAALLLAALCLAAAAAAARADKKADKVAAAIKNLKVDVKLNKPEDLPPTSNPYAGKAYAGCEGGYCPSEDPEVEQELWRAAAAGDAARVKQLLSDDRLNLTRNVVPDESGLARVVDVAVWAASRAGHVDAMKELLRFGGVKELYEYEDGHIVDLAAGEGHEAMVQLLLEEKMPVGSGAMAHAAHRNHTKVMSRLFNKPQDLKATIQAVTGGGSPAMAEILVKAMRQAEKAREKRPNEFDWQTDYVLQAVTNGNIEVLKLLLADDDYSVPWQAAQGLVMAASDKGNKPILELLLSQKVFQEDADELDEAVDNGLKVAAEMGREEIVDMFLEKFPGPSKAHCKAALFRAMKYGHQGVRERLAALCPVDAEGNPKLEAADWLGQVAVAARDGDADALRVLLKHPEAEQRISKLQTIEANDKSPDKGKKRPPHPWHDPLVVAAGAGHREAVELLAPFKALCAACGAPAAAKKNFTEIVKLLAEGAGAAVLSGDGSTIDHALRVMAYSMEEGNWDLVAWLVNKHESKELGPYFFPAIAQGGKMADLAAMMEIMAKEGINKTPYFQEQVLSAKITGALAGHVDVVLELDKYLEPLGGGDEEGGGGDEDGAGDEGAKDEL